MLQPLVVELLFDVHAVRNGALGFFAVLGVVTAEGNELLANGTRGAGTLATLGSILSLAGLGVLHDSLHLDARRTAAVGVATLASMEQTLDAPLNGHSTGLAWRGCRRSASSWIAAIQVSTRD